MYNSTNVHFFIADMVSHVPCDSGRHEQEAMLIQSSLNFPANIPPASHHTSQTMTPFLHQQSIIITVNITSLETFQFCNKTKCRRWPLHASVISPYDNVQLLLLLLLLIILLRGPSLKP